MEKSSRRMAERKGLLRGHRSPRTLIDAVLYKTNFYFNIRSGLGKVSMKYYDLAIPHKGSFIRATKQII